MAGIGEMLAGLFSGPNYQYNGNVVAPQGGPINWGDPNLPSDFFRASQASIAKPTAAPNMAARRPDILAPLTGPAIAPNTQPIPMVRVPDILAGMSDADPRLSSAPMGRAPDIVAPLGGGAMDPRMLPAAMGRAPDITAEMMGGAMDPRFLQAPMGRRPDIQAPVMAPPQPPQFGLPNPYAPQMLTDPRRMQSKHFQPRHQPDYGQTYAR